MDTLADADRYEDAAVHRDRLAAFVKAELAKYGPVVKASGAKVD